MASLTGALAIATRALLNDNAGIDITSNNIANANTEGYSRQRPVFEETAPIQYGNLEFGNGANLQQVESVRDKLLEIRIQQETQQQADSGAYLGAMQQVQSLIGNAQGGSLETAINGFFDSLTQLTSDPSNPSIRQNVLTAGQNVAAEFNRLSTNLNQTRAQLDQQVSGATDSVNQLTSQIAALNPQIALLQASGQNAGTLEDQRTQLINQLSQLIDVNTVQSDNGFTLTTAGGAALVVGNQSFQLTTQRDPTTAMLHIYSSSGTDITSGVQAGQLHGLIQARDSSIPAYLTQLDNLAGGLGNAVNTAHTAGFDINGNQGGKFFNVSAGAGAAGNIQVAITDSSQVAASSDGSVGSNGNATILAAIRSQAIAGGKTASQNISNLVFQVGNDVSQASSRQDAQNMALQQLQSQRSAISGVSLDEEAANLVKYQNAFQAAARVISTIDLLTQTVINMGASSTT
jgi:flagellar hook-associated protein 1